MEAHMKKTPKISEAEWEVMKVLWSTSPATANEIVKILCGMTVWKRETIRTLINRLVQKKAVGFEKKGRQYHYFPLVTKGECVRAETRSFVKRFGGSIEPMLAAFVEEEKLSPEKLARLALVGEHTRQRSDCFDCSGPENPAAQIGDSVALLSLAAVTNTPGDALAARKQDKCLQFSSAIYSTWADNRILLGSSE
jgi:BlaI family penicillinase repressor